MAQREFALKYMPDDELFHIVSTIYEVMPGVLTEHGKTKNPYVFSSHNIFHGVLYLVITEDFVISCGLNLLLFE